jgi:aminoglycoside phosphotransferase (APT) family kinase protein
MLHGDYRADNIMFDDADTPVVLDFQLIGTGVGAYDLAYMVTQSLSADDASVNEQGLFARWQDGLRAGGVSASDLERAWDDYRNAALFCLVYPIVASRGMDFSDPRQCALLDTMNDGFARAVDELNLAALL